MGRSTACSAHTHRRACRRSAHGRSSSSTKARYRNLRHTHVRAAFLLRSEGPGHEGRVGTCGQRAHTFGAFDFARGAWHALRHLSRSPARSAPLRDLLRHVGRARSRRRAHVLQRIFEVSTTPGHVGSQEWGRHDRGGARSLRPPVVGQRCAQPVHQVLNVNTRARPGPVIFCR